MEVAVSVCWSESCRERAQTGFSELCSSRCLHPQSRPAGAFHALRHTSLVLHCPRAGSTQHVLSLGFTVRQGLIINILYHHGLFTAHFLNVSMRKVTIIWSDHCCYWQFNHSSQTIWRLYESKSSSDFTEVHKIWKEMRNH